MNIHNLYVATFIHKSMGGYECFLFIKELKSKGSAYGESKKLYG